jgi:hypothetical protein
MKNICKGVGCNKYCHGQGYCSRHYTQIRRYGSILARTSRDNNMITISNSFAYIDLFNKKNEVIAQAIIDVEDVKNVKGYKWCLQTNGYVAGTKSRNTRYLLHRLIMNTSSPIPFIDHINMNKLDNCKSNLRVCNNSQNMMNGSKRKNNTSGIVGVRWNHSTKKWSARIMVNYKTIYLGEFTTVQEAKEKRVIAEKKYFGEFAPNGR